MSWLLRMKGIGCPDDLGQRYAHPDRARHARIVAEVACEAGLGDQVAWEVLCGPVAIWGVDSKGKPKLHLKGALAAYQAVYGNRKGRARRPTRGVMSAP